MNVPPETHLDATLSTRRLKPERIGVGNAGSDMLRPKRRHRDGFVKPDERVKLLGKRGTRVMAAQFGFRPIDHADEALQPTLQKPLAKRIVAFDVEQETRDAAIMAKPFVAVVVGRPHPLDLHLAVPVGGRGDCPGMRAEPDQGCLVAEALAAELADIYFVPDNPHFGVACVADMGIMRPHDRLGVRPASFQQMLERLEHMGVA